MSDPPPCAIRSRDDDEPLGATASRVDEWVLYRRDGAWGRQALTESGLPEPVGALLRATDRRPRTKAVLVRRTVASDGGPIAVVRARSTVGDERIEHHALDPDGESVERQTLAPQALVDEVTALVDRPPAPWTPGDPLLLAVCTNGRHDQCCANLGRPLVRALRALDEPVWECSHIGGDRFAGNVLVLPHGLYFGRVTPEALEGFLADLHAGLLPMDHYRGRSALSMPAQAAEIAVRREVGEHAVDALTGWRLQATGEGRWHVAIDLAGATYAVAVRRASDVTPRLLTCDADHPSPPRQFVCGQVERTDR